MRAEVIGGGNGKRSIFTVDRVNSFVLVNIQFVMLGDAAVVFEGLGARGLLIHAGHREIADLEKLRSSEERHVRRVIVERVDDATLVDDYDVEAAAFELEAAGEAGRSGADHNGVEGRKLHHNLLSISAESAVSA